MGSIMSWVRASSGWVKSPFGDLPSLRADDTPAHQTWLILAGGMALLLSRASEAELEERFAATRHVYAVARARLQKRRLPKPEPTLLRDALQEIANLADPMTKEAGRECLARSVERLTTKARAGGPASTSSAPSSNAGGSAPVPLSSHQSTQASTHAQSLAPVTAAGLVNIATTDNEETQLDLDLLFERTRRLRDTVAWARTTTFGQDN